MEYQCNGHTDIEIELWRYTEYSTVQDDTRTTVE